MERNNLEALHGLPSFGLRLTRSLNGYILDQPEPLTQRAVAFLRDRAGTWRYDPEPAGAAEIEQMAARFGLTAEEIAQGITRIQARFGGLRYRSDAWSFEEVIRFGPTLDFDDEDTEPMLELVEHTVAHPFTVWTGLNGSVWYICPSENGAEFVLVFNRIEDLIEADALYAECANWDLIAGGGVDSIVDVQARCTSLRLIEEGSGVTESWWDGDEFRVHIWRTWAKVFNIDRLSRWAIWARSSRGQENAREFASGLIE